MPACSGFGITWPLALPGDDPADQLLRAAVVIQLGRVDEGHSQRDADPERVLLLRRRVAPLAKGRGPYTAVRPPSTASFAP